MTKKNWGGGTRSSSGTEEFVARYYSDDDRDSAGCLTTLLLGIIIVSVLLYVAAIALYYIFIGIVIIAAIVGTVITLKNYILEFKNAISNYKNASAPANWKLPVFFYRWFKISWESLKGCWKNNINSIKASFQSGSAFRFISIRRWFYWILALSVAVFGALATLFILELHLIIATFLINILLYFVVAFVVMMAAAGFAFSLFSVFKYYFSELKNRPTATGAGSLARYICKHGYRDVFSMIKLLWQNSNAVLFQSKAQIRPFNFLSIKKWFNIGVMLLIHLTTAVVTPLIFILHMVVQSILFVIFSFANKGF